LDKLPIAQTNMRIEAHKKELIEKLERVNKALVTFSKPTVYVAM
jgi:hypothetical protein